MLEKARGKVLVIDEAYNLDDSLYGKQACIDGLAVFVSYNNIFVPTAKAVDSPKYGFHLVIFLANAQLFCYIPNPDTSFQRWHVQN